MKSRSPSIQPTGMSAPMPPTRVSVVVRRAPIHSSSSLYTRSRSWNDQRNGVNAPMSMQVVPSHTRCEMMRDSSSAITRSTLHRSVISMPNSRSAPNAKATLLPGELR